jgi:PAS domain-containing protein
MGNWQDPFGDDRSVGWPVEPDGFAGTRSCLWCGVQLAPAEGAGLPRAPATCDSCASVLVAGQRQPLAEFIESVTQPVLVLSADAVVEMANSRARVFLGKTAKDIEGRRGGEVIECVNSRLPQGCGRTTNCTGCVLRRSVEHTHATGEALSGVLAFQDVRTASGIKKTCFEISTERAGSLVLVRIDRVGVERRA